MEPTYIETLVAIDRRIGSPAEEVGGEYDPMKLAGAMIEGDEEEREEPEVEFEN